MVFNMRRLMVVNREVLNRLGQQPLTQRLVMEQSNGLLFLLMSESLCAWRIRRWYACCVYGYGLYQKREYYQCPKISELIADKIETGNLKKKLIYRL